jgi:hypothetical protein
MRIILSGGASLCSMGGLIYVLRGSNKKFSAR